MADLSVNEMQGIIPRSGDAAKIPAEQGRPPAEMAAEEVKAAHSAEAVQEAKNTESRQDQESMPEKQRDALKDAFSDLNNVMSSFSKSIRFAVFEQSGDLYAQVINTDNNEVVKTIPSEEALEMMSRIHEVLGMLVDQEG